MVFIYLVTIKLRRSEDLPTFLRLFEPLRLYCNELEENTLGYEIFRDKTCDRTVLILERYRCVADLEVTHRASEPFQTFCAALGPLDIIEEKTNGSFLSELLPPVPLPTAVASTAVPATSLGNLAEKGCLVFCGSRCGTKQAYLEAAERLGEGLATRRKTLVYGGGTVGVMGALANAVHRTTTAATAAAGKIQSVIPRALMPREVSGESLGELFVTDTMSQRKSIMFALADVVIALPGGIGTFDELLEVLTLYQLNAYRPRIGIVNVAGFFDPMLKMLEHMIAEGFLEPGAMSYFIVKPTSEELLHALLDDAAYAAGTNSVANLANLKWDCPP